MKEFTFEQIVTHLKTSGYVFQGSEIYGGLSNTWDFGPLGVNLKKNIKPVMKQRVTLLKREFLNGAVYPFSDWKAAYLNNPYCSPI